MPCIEYRMLLFSTKEKGVYNTVQVKDMSEIQKLLNLLFSWNNTQYDELVNSLIQHPNHSQHRIKELQQ